MRQNKIIGLTGGSGSGKSAVADALKKLGCFVIDCDKIAHENMAKGGIAYDEILCGFGSEILLPDGEIDRKKLGQIVFNDSAQLDRLNKITHKHIIARVRELAENAAGTVIIDAPLLRQTGLDALCDEVWITDAPAEVRVQRIMERDGITRQAAQSRINSQNISDYAGGDKRIITNFDTLEQLESFVKELLE